MVQPRREPGLLAEIGEKVLVHDPPMRDLERHAHSLDRIVGLVYRGERAVGQSFLDPVFP